MENHIKRVAVVTAAGSGIGEALANRLAASGYTLGLLDIDKEKVSRVEAKVRAAGGRVVAAACDVRNAGNVADAFKWIRAELGPVEVLANVVGGSISNRPIEEITEEQWNAVLELNLRGLFLCTRAVVPDMKARRWGRIVNTSSLAGRSRSLFGGAHYTAAKAGVIGFTRQIAYELAPFGIAANVVAPGVTASERVSAVWETMPKERKDYVERLIPAGRIGTVEESAAAIAFLCSDDASYIHGAVLDVNGGLFIG